MSSTSIRRIRRSVRWFAVKEYVGGALWVLPSVAALVALAAGYGISQIEVGPDSRLRWLAFQGTAADACGDVGAASAVREGGRGAATRFGPLGGPGSGGCQALDDAERSIPRQPSLERIRTAVRALHSKINSRRSPMVEEIRH